MKKVLVVLTLIFGLLLPGTAFAAMDNTGTSYQLPSGWVNSNFVHNSGWEANVCYSDNNSSNRMVVSYTNMWSQLDIREKYSERINYNSNQTKSGANFPDFNHGAQFLKNGFEADNDRFYATYNNYHYFVWIRENTMDGKNVIELNFRHSNYGYDYRFQLFLYPNDAKCNAEKGIADMEKVLNSISYNYSEPTQKVTGSTEKPLRPVNTAGTTVTTAKPAATNAITITLNGKTIVPPVAPIIENGTTLVPIRVISENLGAKVDYNASDRRIKITRGDSDNTVLTMQIGNTTVTKSCRSAGTAKKTLATTPKIVNDYTMVPLRFISENMDCNVVWHGDTRVVELTKNITQTPAQTVPVQTKPAKFANDPILGQWYVVSVIVNHTFQDIGEVVPAKFNADGTWEFHHSNGQVDSGTWEPFAPGGSYMWGVGNEGNTLLAGVNGDIMGMSGYNGITFRLSRDKNNIPTPGTSAIVVNTPVNTPVNTQAVTSTTSNLKLNKYSKYYVYSDDKYHYFLGEISTDKYDRNSIFNKYGDYGSKYSSNSMWNNYGTYGSRYSNYSANDKYASYPPVIFDENGKFVGYVTENKYCRNGVTLSALEVLFTR